MIIKDIKKQIKLSRSGKPYTSILVAFDEYRDGKGNRKWISGFGNKRTWRWQVGDDVQPEITEQNGYLNFSFDDTDKNRLNVYELPATVGFVMDILQYKPSSEGSQDTRPQDQAGAQDYPDEEVDPNDIPF